jgi:mRNA interferase RelE/StbE
VFDVSYTKSAERYFKKLKDKHLKSAFKEAIDKLSVNPFIGKQKSGDLREFWGYDVFYAKSNYEIAYKIYEENRKSIVVVLAGTRENFYDELKRLVRN